MIYREFLCYLLLPAVLLSVLLLAHRLRAADPAARARILLGLPVILVLVVVAVAYTTPWDHWLIVNGVWSYPPDSVLGTIALVPIEEYLFMIGQTVLTGCWTLAVLARRGDRDPGPAERRLRVRHAVGWLLLAAGAGAWAALDTDAWYLGAILVWFGPLLALQNAVGGDVLRAARPGRLAGLSITLLLWSLDAVAIHFGAWRISTGHTVEVHLLGLPLEEGLFFLITNLLIVNSLVLTTHPVMRGRLHRFLSPRRDARAPSPVNS